MSARDLEPDGLLILPHLRIQNANAVSGSLTHGFPAMTAFLGFMWALGRRLASDDMPLKPEKIGVICHWHQEQTVDGYVRTFRLTRNPVGRDGTTAAIVEEGRVHLDVTLVFQVSAVGRSDAINVLFQSDPSLRRKTAWQIRELVGEMRIAGGTVLPPESAPGVRTTPDVIAWPDGEDAQHELFRRLRRRWLPGFCLVGRDDLLRRRMVALREEHPDATLLDAWLDLSRFNFRSGKDDKGNVVWTHDRPAGSGWIVPVPVGYASLTELQDGGSVINSRDQQTPFRFVESTYSIGQWMGPHRLRCLHDLFWWGEYQSQGNLYRCCSGYSAPQGADDSPDVSSGSPMDEERV